MDTHTFTPARPGGVVCISDRSDPDDTRGANPCGYPSGHPIHAIASTPAEARTGISDRAAAALKDLAELRRRMDLGPGMLTSEVMMFDRIEQALRGER